MEANNSETIHVSLDNPDYRFGRLKFKFKEFIKHTNCYQKLKKLRKSLKEELTDDYCLKEMYNSKYQNVVTHLGQFANLFVQLINAIYLKDIDNSLFLKQQKAEGDDYAAIKEKILKNSGFNKKQHETLLNSQCFQVYLEELSQKVEKV